MANQHLKVHPLSGNSDHDLTGLNSGQILYVQNPTNGVQSTGLYADGSGGLTSTTASITTLSAGTIYSANTNLYQIFAPFGTVSGVDTVQAGSNVATGGTAVNPIISVIASPSFNNVTFSGTATGGNVYGTNVSGGTLYSGATNLYNIFAQPSLVVNNVNAGSNITTGGTAISPTINLTDSPSVNNINFSGTATGGNVYGINVSGGTLYSGSTNLYNIFTQGSGTPGTIPLWCGSTVLGNSIIVQSGTGVTVNGSVNIFGDVNVLGTATTFNTQTVQSQDNNIVLNYSGSYVSAYGGGITVLSGNVNGGSSTWTIDSNGSWSSNTAILTSAITVNGGNVNVNGGGQLQSGGTNLYSIFAQPSLVVNNVNAGTNITTGGTAISPIISTVASPIFNNVTFSGNAIGGNIQAAAATFTSVSGGTVSGGTIYSGSTNLYDIFLTNADVSATTVTAGSNIAVSNVGLNYTVATVASPSFNNFNVSGTANFTGAIQSGGTDLYSIFQGIGTDTDHTAVQNGLNTYTGGTAQAPTVNVSAATLTYLSATTISGGTINSGSTNLYQIFATPAQLANYIPLTGTGLNLVTGDVMFDDGINIIWTTGTDFLQYNPVSTNVELATSNGFDLTSGAMMSAGTDLYSIFATAGQDVTTASNGLTKTNNNITLGGSLTADTYIQNSGNMFRADSFSAVTVSANTVFTSELSGMSPVNLNGIATLNDAGNTLAMKASKTITSEAAGVTTMIEMDKFGGNELFISTNAGDFNAAYIDMYGDLTSTYLDVNAGTTGTSVSGGFFRGEQGGGNYSLGGVYFHDSGGNWQTRLYQTTVNFQNGSAGAMGISIIGSGTSIPTNTSRGIIIKDNTTNSLTSKNQTNPAITIGTRNSTINAGVVNTVIIGGSGITASQNNSLYAQNARLAEIGGVIYSAGTDLYSIFSTAGSVVPTYVQPGSNITTGGTASAPIVSLNASPSVNGLSVSGTGNFTGTLQSGGTDLNNIFVQGSGTSGTIPVWNGSMLLGNSLLTQSGTGVTVNGSVYIYGNVDILGTATTFNTQTVQAADNNITLNMSGSYVTAYGGGITILSGNVNGGSSTWTIDSNGAWSANTAILTSAITVNGGNINVNGGGQLQSGGTNLYNIFAQPSLVVNNVNAGTNIATGGTAISPIISTVASPVFNSITFSGNAIGGNVQAAAATFTSVSGGTVSGGTLYSGSTNLYNIFAQPSLVVNNIVAGSNITTGGTATSPVINLADSPSVNNLTVSGNTTAQGISGTTIYASQFFQMTPYTGANPSSPNNNDVWFHSGATGIITLNYRVGGVTKTVELA